MILLPGSVMKRGLGKGGPKESETYVLLVNAESFLWVQMYARM